MASLEDRESEECINYNLAKNCVEFKHTHNPELDCSKCKDKYNSECPHYAPKREFAKLSN